MGGKLWIDEDYDSGIPGYPGAKFVVDLHTPPVSLHDVEAESVSQEEEMLLKNSDEEGRPLPHSFHGQDGRLPQNLRVLFVDDDLIVRKLFRRCVLRVAPTWNIEEAANGETALRLVESNEFDIVFMDQYMASIQKVRFLLSAAGCGTMHHILSQPYWLTVLLGLVSRNAAIAGVRNGAYPTC